MPVPSTRGQISGCGISKLQLFINFRGQGDKGDKMSQEIIQNYKSDALQSFRNYKKLAEKAIEQVDDEEFFATIDAEANSIAVVVKHIAGNLHSRWRDFLTSDGE